MKQTTPYTYEQIEAMISHFDLLVNDVSSLAKQLKKAELQNKILVAQNHRLASTLEQLAYASSTGSSGFQTTVH